MSDKPMSQSRRDAVKLMVGTAVAIPVINLMGVGAARAAAPANAVTADDPTAVALQYHEDATKADRVAAARPGMPPAEQIMRRLPVHAARHGRGRLERLHLVPRQVDQCQWLVHVLDREGRLIRRIGARAVLSNGAERPRFSFPGRSFCGAERTCECGHGTRGLTGPWCLQVVAVR